MQKFERIVFLIAAIVSIVAVPFAGWPLYQWYSEREDRRFARLAGLVEAVSTCADAAASQEKTPELAVFCAKVSVRVLAELEQEIAAICDLNYSYPPCREP